MDYAIALLALKQADPILAATIDRVGNCTLDSEQRRGDVLSTLCESIISQQISGKAATTIHRRFLELYNRGSTLNAQNLLDTPDEMLRNAGVSRPKIAYLRDLAQKTIEGLPTLSDLATMEDEAIVRELVKVKGIGRWTAQMLLIFRLHRWDVLPADDLGIRAGIRRIYDLPELPDKKIVEQLGQKWQPYRTIASWYLWRSA
ncbi:MAG: DNA-3-methyladenine glycosylase [Cyanobacteriota bacterium]|nr:DNA-3-methyladenine glycosylase [Cyanobacteriota bacterium]